MPVYARIEGAAKKTATPALRDYGHIFHFTFRSCTDDGPDRITISMKLQTLFQKLGNAVNSFC